MNTVAQSKLLEAARLLTEAAAALGQPAPLPQVMQRIALAKEAQQKTSIAAGGGVARNVVAKLGKPAKKRRQRAQFYLRIASPNDPTQDAIWRVIGPRGVEAASRLSSAAKAQGQVVEQLNSRGYALLVEARQRQVRDGVTSFVGACSSEDLTGLTDSQMPLFQ